MIIISHLLNMKLSNIDLNLLVYFDALLQEKNVTNAAQQLGISQPAMSNSLKRLRELFNDPILVRTSEGMAPTLKALELQPKIHRALTNIEYFIQPTLNFSPEESERVFRITASDYAEATLIPGILKTLREIAPKVTLDIMNPSDVNFNDMEQGKVDLAINRFDKIPVTFHQLNLLADDFSCVLRADNPFVDELNLVNYLKSHHVWVSKSGIGMSANLSAEELQKMGWVDMALSNIDKRRKIAVFTRHFLSALQLVQEHNLIVTLPTRAAQKAVNYNNLVIRPVPFNIDPIELHVLWPPILNDNPGHVWLRKIITDVASNVDE